MSKKNRGFQGKSDKRDSASIDIEVNEKNDAVKEEASSAAEKETSRDNAFTANSSSIPYLMGDTEIVPDTPLLLKRCQFGACAPEIALEDIFSVSCSTDNAVTVSNKSERVLTLSISADRSSRIEVPHMTSKEINIQNGKYTTDIFYSPDYSSFLISVDDRRIAHTNDHDLSMDIHRCEAGTCSPENALDVLWHIGFDSSDNKSLYVDCIEETTLYMHIAPSDSAILKNVKAVDLNTFDSDLYIRIARKDIAEAEAEENEE